MMAIAFASALWIAMQRAPKRGIEAKVIVDLAVLTLIFGLAGARATYVFTHIAEFRGRWLDTISPIQSDGKIGIAGLVLLGGVLAGFAAAFFIARRKKARFLTITDILIPSLTLGIAFGRLGCFFNGCCFGLPGSTPLCVVFPSESLAGSVYPRTLIHPTQLYEVSAMLVLFAFLLWFDRRPRATGLLTGMFLILYGVWRFFVEGLRWYEESMIIGMLGDSRFTLSRLITVGMVLVGLFLIWKVRAKPGGEIST
jgi:phosphatidylglycerol:prolipoprotein diacylglycerol transferase